MLVIRVNWVNMTELWGQIQAKWDLVRVSGGVWVIQVRVTRVLLYSLRLWTLCNSAKCYLFTVSSQSWAPVSFTKMRWTSRISLILLASLSISWRLFIPLSTDRRDITSSLKSPLKHLNLKGGQFGFCAPSFFVAFCPFNWHCAYLVNMLTMRAYGASLRDERNEMYSCWCSCEWEKDF